jgi:hypothetical protein
MYPITPVGVDSQRHAEDAAAAMKAGHEFGVPIVAPG